MNIDFDDQVFRQLLVDEFQRRRAVNHRYSLRAFALSLGISHATLSHLLAGRRKITKYTYLRLSQKFNVEAQVLSPETVEFP